jgi:putative membrane protein
MMYWGNGTGGWGMILMTVSTLVFWGLVIAGIVALVRYAGRGGDGGYGGAPNRQPPAPQQVLAERFARGEIDEDEYARRLRILSDTAPTSDTAPAGGTPPAG